MAATPRATPTVSILIKDKKGLGSPDKKGEDPWECKVDKGELLIEIPEKDRVQVGGKERQPHNYRLYSDPVTLYATPTDSMPLKEEEFRYLLAVTPPSLRIQIYMNTNKMKEKMCLVEDDAVTFKMRLTPKGADSYVTGVIRYIGPLEESEGTFFGIEIVEEKWFGKGTTNGRPYFTCGKKNGVFVSMDKIIQKSNYSQRQLSKTLDSVIKNQPTSKDPQGGPPAENTRSQLSKISSKVKEMAAQLTQPTPPEAVPVEDTDISYQHQSEFKPGHRVVLQSAKGDVINGTVRWVGPVRISSDRSVPPVPVVGVETDKSINPETDFPDLHVSVTGSHGQKFFKVSSNHTRVFLPESLVVHADEFKRQQENDDSTQMEQKIAKELGISVEEYRSQHKYLHKANTDRDISDYNRKARDNSAIGEEEHGNEEGRMFGAGQFGGGDRGGGERRGGDEEENDDHRQMEDTLVAVETGQVSDKRFKEQEEALERFKEKQEREKRNLQQQDQSHDYQVIGGGIEESDDDSYVNVQLIPYALSQQGDNSGGSRNSPRLPTVKEDHPLGSANTPLSRSTHSPRSHHTHYNDDHNGPTSLPSIPTNAPPTAPPTDPLTQFSIGSMVTVARQRGSPLNGVIRWIGTLPDCEGTVAGVELDESLKGCTNGTWQEMRFFHCPQGRGFFCPLKALQQDTRYLDEGQIPANMRQDVTNPLADKAPLTEEDDMTPGPPMVYIGDGHGIQGHHNSCYLDSTVFGLFALSDSFDELLIAEPQEVVGQKVKHFLWKGIVNPLRKYGLARHESVMELRNSLEEFGQMKGANTDEKDPEEFLNLLFKHVLHIEPFLSIKRPFGVEKEYFVQLFFELDPKGNEVPKTEKLIAQMFHEQNISFTQVPSKLLLQMPRFGKEFKMYNRIIPSLELNVTPLLDGYSKVQKKDKQKCSFCLSPSVTKQCHNCPKEVVHSDTPLVYYCNECSERCHRSRRGHRVEDYIEATTDDVNMISNMQLLSVICIETSHYVCYTRSGDQWLFHDSMANRLYDMYNIPKVVDVSYELNEWVYSGRNTDRLMNAPSREIPEYVRRFTQDIYMCVYVNPDLELYGDAPPSLPPLYTNPPPHDTPRPLNVPNDQQPYNPHGQQHYDTYTDPHQGGPQYYPQDDHYERRNDDPRYNEERNDHRDGRIRNDEHYGIHGAYNSDNYNHRNDRNYSYDYDSSNRGYPGSHHQRGMGGGYSSDV